MGNPRHPGNNNESVEEVIVASSSSGHPGNNNEPVEEVIVASSSNSEEEEEEEEEPEDDIVFWDGPGVRELLNAHQCGPKCFVRYDGYHVVNGIRQGKYFVQNCALMEAGLEQCAGFGLIELFFQHVLARIKDESEVKWTEVKKFAATQTGGVIGPIESYCDEKIAEFGQFDDELVDESDDELVDE